MNEAHIQKIAAELKVQPRQVLATARLFAEGATVPFIARYRKEATGSLDEVAITSIRERLLSLADLDQRREAILKSLAERNLLSDELKAAVTPGRNADALEDIYPAVPPQAPHPRDHRPGTGARAAGRYSVQQQATADPQAEAAQFVSAEKGVADAAAALAGARDILAERVSDDAQRPRQVARRCIGDQGLVKSKVMSDKVRRRPPSSRTTLTGASPSPKFPATGCWPSGAARRKAS